MDKHSLYMYILYFDNLSVYSVKFMVVISHHRINASIKYIYDIVYEKYLFFILPFIYRYHYSLKIQTLRKSSKIYYPFQRSNNIINGNSVPFYLW